MAEDSKRMLVTSTGLQKTASEIINKRLYAPNKIEVVGSPLITDEGMASSFTATSYVTIKNVNISNYASVQIGFTGYFFSENNNFQSCWSLESSQTPAYSLGLFLSNSRLELRRGTTNIFRRDIKTTNYEYLNISVTITSDTCSIIIKNDSGVYTFDGNLSVTLDFSIYDSIRIGQSSRSTNLYWVNRINLTDFLVYGGKDLIYSISDESYVQFSKIMISDGTIPLADDSFPVIDHVREFSITELNRTANSILLRTDISKDVYLVINEIGLYIKTEDGSEKLFSVIRDLSIKKTADVSYDLIFNVDLTVEVLNTTIIPDIVLKESRYLSLEELEILKRVHADVAIDMERTIVDTATQIGYDPERTANMTLSNANKCQRDLSYVQAYKNAYKNITSASIDDFYGFYSYPFPYSLYFSNNLSGLANSRIRVLEETLVGDKDAIDFSHPEGFTLSIAISFQGAGDKVLLCKSRLDDNERYFSLAIEDYDIVFRLYLEDEVVVLKKELSAQTLQDLAGGCLITIVCDRSEFTPEYYMYIGKENVAQVQGGSINFKPSGLYVLTNAGATEYNISMFTVVGNPNITAEGVLTTTSASNYLKTPSFVLGDNWEINVSLFSQTLRSGQADTVLRSLANSNNLSIGIGWNRMNTWMRDIYNGNIVVNYPKIGNNAVTQIANRLCLLKLSCSFDGEYYTIIASISNDGGATWYDSVPTVTPEIPYVARNPESWALQPYRITNDTSMELKYFSIVSEGKTIFSGKAFGASENYIQNIVSFTGALSGADIHYLSCLLGVNQ